MKKGLLACVLFLATTTTVHAEMLTGRMIINSKDARVMGIETLKGLVALNYSPEMKLLGIGSLDGLKPCDEVTINAVRSGASRSIAFLELRKRDEGKACPPQSAPFVPPAEFYQAVEKKTAAIIDVRTPEEFSKLHFEGAVNIPLGEIEARRGELPKDLPILIYCSTARRSAFAVLLLKEKGIESKMVKGKFMVMNGKPQLIE